MGPAPFPHQRGRSLFHFSGQTAAACNTSPMRTTLFGRSVLLIGAFVATSTAFTDAQQRAATTPRALTTDDYARAERYMPYNVTPLMTNGAVRPTWLPNSNRFWYRNQLADNRSEFVLVDATQGSKSPAFNHAALAA